MGKKDTIGKMYFMDTARFAEFMNAVLYHGEKIILPENLVSAEREYPSLSGNADRHRDIFMEDAGCHILYSLELEAESDYGMPEYGFHLAEADYMEPEAVQAIAVHIDSKRLMPRVKKEGTEMCQAFDELMEDMKMEGIREGREEGRIEGENRFARLVGMLIDGGRNEEVKRAAADSNYREQLYMEMNLA